MAETFVDRARVAMARIKDDTSPLDSTVSAAIALKYANAFIKVHRPDLLVNVDPDTRITTPVDIATIPNETKAQVYINKLREFHMETLITSRVHEAGDAARIAEQATIETEFPIDLGAEE